MPNYAPIALFVYNRPAHTRLTVEALSRNVGAADSRLHVFSDGPGDDSSRAGVAEVRKYLRGIEGFGRMEIHERETNLGLARSIIDGVSQLCERYGQVIVVEDDMLTSRWFLQYLNDGLEVFRHDETVASIHAYLPPIGRAPPGNFFLYGADCWGWATWQRAWSRFDTDAGSLLRRLKSHPQKNFFDYAFGRPHTRMLRNNLEGRNDSWAIRWHASTFLDGMLTLHPSMALVNNIGLDGSGTHCNENDDMSTGVWNERLSVQRIPLEHSGAQWRSFQRHFVRQLIGRAWRRVVS